MSKHTPGEWTVDKTNALGAYGVWAEFQKNPSGMSQVCSVFVNNKSDFPREMRDANAKLIAAAPELLEACKLLMKQITDGTVDFFEIQHDGKSAIETIEKLLERLDG